jgi:hypothetical protein
MKITHSCGCTAKKPCPRGWAHHVSGDRHLLERHLERTMLVDGEPLVVHLRFRSVRAEQVRS